MFRALADGPEPFLMHGAYVVTESRIAIIWPIA